MRGGGASDEIAGAQSGLPPAKAEYFTNAPREAAQEAEKTSIVVVGKGYMLDFQEADIKSVVDAVLGDMLKLDYSVAPQLQGKLTLRTGRPIDRDAVLPALEAALASASAVLVAQGNGYQVVPLESASQRVRNAFVSSPGQKAVPGFAVEIVPLRFAAAKEMQRVLEVFAPKGSILQADEVHNHVVIAGSSIDRAAMMRAIESFDTDAMQGMTFVFFRLDNLSAEQMIAELKQVFQGSIDLGARRVRLVPVDRLQTVLGIAPNRADLEFVETWIRRLDLAPKSGERRLFVYNVQNGSAKDLAASLQLVLTGEAAAAPARTGTPSSSGSNRSDAAPPPAPSTPPSARGQSRIVANEENNSLLILGTEAEYRLVKDALAKLDVLPRQVLIEAILAEVTLGHDLRFGVQWFFESGEGKGTFSSSETGALLSQFPGFSYVYSGRANARVVLNALQSKTDVKVLSAPKLAVLNNQKASLQVGDEIPIRTQVSQGTAAPGAPVVSSIQMRETGVILEVTPRINDNGNVILDVAQEVSDVTSTTSSGIDSPTIQRRRLRSVITARDGATIALGGLIRETGSRGNSGIPLLKDMPYVGHLFRTDTNATRRTELIVLLVPHVMRDPEETRNVVDALVNGAKAASEIASHATPLLRKKTD
jgi:general secretion pathway protein D